MLSPTRKKLENKKQRHLLTVGFLDIANAAVWGRIADLTLAEGKKLEGSLEALIAGLYGILAIRHIKSSK